MDGVLMHGQSTLAAGNRAVIAGDLPLADFIAQQRPLDTAGWGTGRSTVTRVGMIAASVAGHLAAGGDTGVTAVWRELPEAERMLAELAPPDDPPRDVIATYVPGECFLGTAAEFAFKAAIVQVDRAYAEVGSLVGPLRDPAAWDRSDAAPRLVAARTPLLLGRAVLIEVAQAAEEARAGLRELARGFYRPLVVNGVRYEGIDIAHVETVASADVVLGADGPACRAHLADVRRHLVHEHRARLDRALAEPSLAGALAERLGSREFDSARAAAALRAAPPGLSAAVTAYARLAKTHADVSGAYAGLADRVLREPAADVADFGDTAKARTGDHHPDVRANSLVEARHEAARRLAGLVAGAARLPFSTPMGQVG